MKETLSKQFFSQSELPEILNIAKSRIMTIVGAGGKTTLLHSLSLAFLEGSFKTLLTTSTHMMRPDSLSEAVFVEKEEVKMLYQAFRLSNLAALGLPCQRNAASPIKWASPSPDFLQNIAALPDKIICEGDGSKGLPLKVPRSKEPVFYPGTDTVLGVIGLSALHRPVRDLVFGWEVSPISLPELVTPELLVKIALSPRGLQKKVQKETFHVIFNQADTLEEEDYPAIASAAKKIRDNGVFCHIVSLKYSYFLKDPAR